ncbi:MAG: M1 family metallopeptidase [Herbiconiux sp.]|nr:M1 family metallopeptidase [Herbiconiux sp.]
MRARDPYTHGSSSGGDDYIPTSGNGGYSVEHYALELDYRVVTNRMQGTAVIRAHSTQELSRFSLDFAGLSVMKVTVDGVRPRKLAETVRKLVITPETPIEAGVPFEVTVRYRGAPHPIRSAWGEVGWEELADGVIVAGQPCGAASWFPCNDEPGDKATYSIALTCEAGYTVVSNGVLAGRSSRSGRTTWRYEMAQPMSTYLATVQIGRYRTRAVAGTAVTQKLHYPAALERQVLTDFGRVPEMVELFSSLFGPYPFEGYDVVVTHDVLEIPLEAQGLAVFGRNHVDGAHGSDRLIAHELAHQWFGNSLTLGRWRDIWLHEGFACYAEWLWAEGSGGRTADALAREHRARLSAEPQDIVIGDPGPQGMFDDRVYKRGALALHAIRLAIGDEAFFGALRAYAAAFRFGVVSTEDFVESVEAHGGQGLIGALVERWVYEKGLPKL